MIHSDAKGYLRNLVQKCVDLELKMKASISKASYALKFSGNAKLEKALVQAEEVKQSTEKYRLEMEKLLSIEALSPDSDSDPHAITDIYSSTSGDWNGTKFGELKVRGKLLIYKNTFFDVTGPYSKDEAKIFCKKYYEAERSEIEYLTSRADETLPKLAREPIPERVRNEVWRRDQGKCVKCGSTYNLEFDHVIPVTKGGSNTARNLRILCEPCNRRKSDKIG